LQNLYFRKEDLEPIDRSISDFEPMYEEGEDAFANTFEDWDEYCGTPDTIFEEVC